MKADKHKRIVIKIGTSVITTGTGRVDYKQLKDLVDQLSALAKKGHQVIVVTSGAIAVGVEAIGLERRPTAIPELQAAASVGQGLLIQKYAELFDQSRLNVGQILLTQYDFTYREHYLNAKNTLEKLLELKVIPIINENDTTAVEEIRGEFLAIDTALARLQPGELCLILIDQVEEALAHIAGRLAEVSIERPAKAAAQGEVRLERQAAA